MSLIHGKQANGKLIPMLVDANGRVITVLDTGTGIVGKVDINTMPQVSAQLVAGSAHIGEVAVNSIPQVSAQLVAGSANIGDVDIATIPTVTIQGTNNDKLLSISGIIYPAYYNGNTQSATLSVTLGTIYTGFIAKLTYWTYKLIGTMTGVKALLYANINGNPNILAENSTITSDKNYYGGCELYLQPSDSVNLYVSGLTNGSVVYCQCNGYQFHTT